MITTDILLSLALGLLGAAALCLGFKWRHPRGRRRLAPSFAFAATLLFGFTWAGGVWLPPLGPAVRGVAFMPFLLTALFEGMLIGILGSTPRAAADPDAETAQTAVAEVPTPFDRAFIVLVGGLVLLSIIGYLA